MKVSRAISIVLAGMLVALLVVSCRKHAPAPTPGGSPKFGITNTPGLIDLTNDLGGSPPTPEVVGLLNSPLPDAGAGCLEQTGDAGWAYTLCSGLDGSAPITALTGPVIGTGSSTIATTLAQEGAITGNTYGWNGSAWAPSALNLAGGSGYVNNSLPVANQAPQYVFIFQPGGTAGGNIYTSWPSLITARATVSGPAVIQLDNTFSAITIPSGTWAVDYTTLQGVGIQSSGLITQVTLASGAIFSPYHWLILDHVVLISDSSSNIVTFTSSNPTPLTILRGESGVESTGGSPFFHVSSMAGSGFPTFICDFGYIGIGSSTIQVDPGTTTIIGLQGFSAINSSALSGTGTIDLVVDASNQIASQAAFTGTLNVTYRALSSQVSYSPATAANWNPSPTLVNTALDQLAARLSASSGTLVFRPGGTAGENVYTTWSSLYTAASTIQGQPVVLIDTSDGTAQIPSGTWAMDAWVLRGIGTPYATILGVASGATLTFNKLFLDNVILQNQGTGTPITMSAANQTIYVANWSELSSSSGSSPLVQVASTTAAIVIDNNSSISGSTPAITINSSDLLGLTLVARSANINGTIEGAGNLSIYTGADAVVGTTTVSGTVTVTPYGEATLVNYSPATAANWSPSTGLTAATALDQLASRVPASGITVSNGGTGDTSLTAHNVLLGEGTSPIGFAAPGVSGTVLVSQGASSDPAFTTITNASLATGTFSHIAGVGTLTSGALGSGFTPVTVALGGTGESSQTTDGVAWDNGTGITTTAAPSQPGQTIEWDGGVWGPYTLAYHVTTFCASGCSVTSSGSTYTPHTLNLQIDACGAGGGGGGGANGRSVVGSGGGNDGGGGGGAAGPIAHIALALASLSAITVNFQTTGGSGGSSGAPQASNGQFGGVSALIQSSNSIWTLNGGNGGTGGSQYNSITNLNIAGGGGSGPSFGGAFTPRYSTTVYPSSPGQGGNGGGLDIPNSIIVQGMAGADALFAFGGISTFAGGTAGSQGSSSGGLGGGGGGGSPQGAGGTGGNGGNGCGSTGCTGGGAATAGGLCAGGGGGGAGGASTLSTGLNGSSGQAGGGAWIQITEYY